MRRDKHSGTMLLVALIIGIFWVNSASAIPAFARKYDKGCSSCHTAYPQLNQIGRQFKEAGYRFSNDSDKANKISDSLYLDDTFPISGVIISRPYDKKDSGDKKIRALHEVEIIVAGVIGEHWSGYFEIEAEDETGFEPELAPAVLSYNINETFNLQAIYGPYFWADPYGFLGDHFRLTRGHVGVIDQKYGGADAGGRMRSNRQNIGIYGRPTEQLFYNLVVSGVADDAEGEDASSFSGRVAFDFTPGIMLGAYGISGSDEATNLDFSRYGIDGQYDFGMGGRLQAAYTTASDDVAGGGSVDNDAYSVQAMWVFTNDSLKPTWVPLIRLDSYETNDGADEFDELTLNVSYYLTENIKVYLEYWDRYDAPTSAQEDSRVTLQIHAAF
jgi:hypothetical protein